MLQVRNRFRKSPRLQSDETMAIDGIYDGIFLRFRLSRASGKGSLSLKTAKNFHRFLKRKGDLSQIKNDDKLYLPRVIAVGIA